MFMKERVLAVSIILCIGPFSLWAAPTDVPNGMGIFFSDTDFSDQTTNINTNQSVHAYLVLINADIDGVGGYRCGIQHPTSVLLQINAGSQTHGWTNAGNNTNHIVTFTDAAKPVEPNGTVVLCTMVLFPVGTDLMEFKLGPSTPRGLTGWNGPVIIGPDPDDVRPAFLTSGTSGEGFRTVATLWGDGVTSDQERTWTRVKSLFR
jgi:hypothetical protein